MKEKGKSIKVYLLGMLIVGIGMGLTTVIADTIINSTNVSYKTSTVKAALDDLYGLTADDIWQKIYPVGSIYISASSTSPATLFGGTWVAFGQGRTLVGINTSDDDFKTAEKTGGSKNHQHVYGIRLGTFFRDVVVEGNPKSGVMNYSTSCTSKNFLTDACSKSVENFTALDQSLWWAGPVINSGSASTTTTLDSSTILATVGSYGKTTNDSSLSPYITVYMWKRTA